MALTTRITNARLSLCLLLFSSILSFAPALNAAPKPKPKTPPVAAPVEPDPVPPPPPAPPPVVDDPLGRSTPFGTVNGFLNAANSKNPAKAVQYLDTKLPEAKAEALALQLKDVLDTGLTSNINGMSRDPLGDLKDGLRVTRERIGGVPTPKGEVDIFLDRISRPGEPNIWLFSSETLAQIPYVDTTLTKRDFSKYFPSPFLQAEIFGLPVWRWLTILLSIVAVIVLSGLVTRLLFRLARLVVDRRHLSSEANFLARLTMPVRVLMLALAITFIQPYTLSLLARSYWAGISRVVASIGFAWLLVRVADIAADSAARRSLAVGATAKIAVITLIQRLFKICAILLIFLLALSRAGVNVSAMLTGLGIGGVALALAAQKTLEDLFGGISIILRDSIRVGDMCRVADETGVIEDVGLSSTRLRTLDRTVVSIPNSKIAQLSSENFSLRDKFWFHHILPLRYDTSVAQIEEIVAKIRKLIEDSSEIEQETVRLNVISLANAAPQIEVYAYLLTSTIELFLAQQQILLLHILSAIEDSGSGLASPSQMAYFEIVQHARAGPRRAGALDQLPSNPP